MILMYFSQGKSWRFNACHSSLFEFAPVNGAESARGVAGRASQGLSVSVVENAPEATMCFAR